MAREMCLKAVSPLNQGTLPAPCDAGFSVREKLCRNGTGQTHMGDWYNNQRLLERLGHIPSAESEKAYYASIGNANSCYAYKKIIT